MAFELTYINGVTKQEKGGKFYYHFADFNVIADPSTGTWQYEGPNRTFSDLVEFSDVTDKKGAANVVEYWDILTAEGVHSAPVYDNNSGGGGGGGDVTIVGDTRPESASQEGTNTRLDALNATASAISQANATKTEQVRSKSVLENIEAKLDQVIFLLSQIASE